MTYHVCLSAKHDISTRKNNMLSSHVKRTLLLWLHVVLPFSIKKMVKWFGIAQGPHSLEKTLNFRGTVVLEKSLNAIIP